MKAQKTKTFRKAVFIKGMKAKKKDGKKKSGVH